MIRRKFIFILSLFLFLGIATLEVQNSNRGSGYDVEVKKQLDTKISKITQNSYTAHVPITISNDADFVVQANLDGWTGDGSISNPYIIEGYKFSDETDFQIDINNVNHYFIIKDSFVENATKGGIRLQHVSNVIITNNIVSDNKGDGIFLNHTSDMLISKNIINSTQQAATFFDDQGISNFPFAIDVTRSTNVIVEDNILHDNIDGIWFWINVKNSIIRRNVVNNHHFEGMGFGGGRANFPFLISNNNTIINNTISNARYGIWIFQDNPDDVIGSFVQDNIVTNSQQGLRIEKTSNITVQENNFNSGTRGIVIIATDNSTVSHNTLQNNTDYGLDLDLFSNNNFISENQFISNNQGDRQLNDRSLGDTNTVEFNYYNEWESPDANEDGYVDEPYEIGSSKVDLFPLAQPTKPANPPPAATANWDIIPIILLTSSSLGVVTLYKRKK